ncbi:MAG: hypothetical protein JO192_05865 [Candidatus Eremiobacteraeota bacterium]|nr:hypothetical protein [Candidatus Eremiobacteraeota bacterium]
MKRAFVIAAAVVLTAALAHGRGSGVVVAAAEPTPAAFQYDEITRMIMPPATPPAPGTFQADYQAVASAPADQHHGGLNNMLGNMMGNPGEMMEKMSRGQVTRYTYYKGWIRTDYASTNTAIIQKCQEHQYITLDLGKKTYTQENTAPACLATNGMKFPGMPNGGSYHSEPGTADMTVGGSSNDLGPLTIDGIGTVGYDMSVSMSTTNATGSCRNSNFSMTQTKYISQIKVPRPFCPLPRTMSTGGMMSQASGGCEPHMHLTGNIHGWADEMDRLVMYMRMAMGERANGMNMVVERGNVKWLSGQAADDLFAIPPGFTQSQ